MPSRVRLYAKQIWKRLAIFGLCIITAFGFHRIFSSVHLEILGAAIFIVGFSLGAMYYYFSLFRMPTIHEVEFIFSIMFIFALTVTMFAVIYAEPIENTNNYFLEFGTRTDLSFSDALYFSASTITTLGYGDILPVGVFRLFVVIEVLMGLIYTGSIIYFIISVFERRAKR